MAIWSRRTLQRMLVHNAVLVDRAASQKHAALLNQCNETILSTEWEVAVLFALSHLGTVVHEAQTSSGARLDVDFKAHDDSLGFIADVVTIHDFGVEKSNPLHEFQAELARHAKRIGVNLAGFNVRIGRREEGELYDSKTYLRLPEKTKLGIVFDGQFKTFLRQIKNCPQEPASFSKHTPEAEVDITYMPGGSSVSGHYPAYTLPQSLTRNPLFNGLDRKADQLKRAAASGLTVIFACDGGSETLRHRPSSSPGTYSSKDIVLRFLRDHIVSAVCVIRVERRPTLVGVGLGPCQLACDVYFHPIVDGDTVRRLTQLFHSMVGRIHQPESDAANAINWLRWREQRVGRSFIGVSEMSRDSMKISARAVQELLAGTLSEEEFLKQHQMVPTEDHKWSWNPFAEALKTGRLIDRVTIEKCPDSDDDWLIFHFSGEDQAIAKFKVP